MLVGMGIVAVVCVILGLIPSIGISMINLAFNFQVPLNQTIFSFGSILRLEILLQIHNLPYSKAKLNQIAVAKY